MGRSMQSTHKEATAAFWHSFHHDGKIHRVEWQWPISGVHSIMMEKSAHAGEGEGCSPNPFHYIYYHVQSCSGSVRSSWEGRYTTPIHLFPYVLCRSEQSKQKHAPLYTYSLQEYCKLQRRKAVLRGEVDQFIW
jgi:hypothetical protein